MCEDRRLRQLHLLYSRLEVSLVVDWLLVAKSLGKCFERVLFVSAVDPWQSK